LRRVRETELRRERNGGKVAAVVGFRESLTRTLGGRKGRTNWFGGGWKKMRK